MFFGGTWEASRIGYTTSGDFGLRPHNPGGRRPRRQRPIAVSRASTSLRVPRVSDLAVVAFSSRNCAVSLRSRCTSCSRLSTDSSGAVTAAVPNSFAQIAANQLAKLVERSVNPQVQHSPFLRPRHSTTAGQTGGQIPVRTLVFRTRVTPSIPVAN